LPGFTQRLVTADADIGEQPVIQLSEVEALAPTGVPPRQSCRAAVKRAHEATRPARDNAMR
jgi:hypothetical protein